MEKGKRGSVRAYANEGGTASRREGAGETRRRNWHGRTSRGGERLCHTRISVCERASEGSYSERLLLKIRFQHFKPEAATSDLL